MSFGLEISRRRLQDGTPIALAVGLCETPIRSNLFYQVLDRSRGQIPVLSCRVQSCWMCDKNRGPRFEELCSGDCLPGVPHDSCWCANAYVSHSFLVVFDGDLLEAVHPPLNLPRERRFTVYWYARFSCSVHTAQSFQTTTDMSWISSDVLFQLCFMIHDASSRNAGKFYTLCSSREVALR